MTAYEPGASLLMRNSPSSSVVTKPESNRHETAAPLEIQQAHREHADPLDRLTVIIGHSTGDRAHAREREVDLFQNLPVGELQQTGLLAWPPLAIFERKIYITRKRESITRGAKIIDLENDVEIGDDGAPRLRNE